MTCHRDGARHCSCAPETAQAQAADAAHLALTSPDPRAHAALRLLASPLEAEVVNVGAGVSHVTGDVAALLVAAAGALLVPAPGTGPTHRRPEVAASLPRRGELLASLQRELAGQRPGTTTALLFCATAPGGLPGPLLGSAAARVRSQLRRSDLLAHCGDGRLVALVPALPLPSAEDVAARLVAAVRHALAEPVATDGELFPLTALVGVLVHPGAPAEGEDGEVDPLTAAEMLAAVERAMERGTLPSV